MFNKFNNIISLLLFKIIYLNKNKIKIKKIKENSDL